MRPDLVAKLAAAIGELVDARVEQRLRELGVGVEQYSGRALPPGVSRRAFFAACRAGRVDGARRDGRGWTCSRSAWVAYRGRGADRPVRGCAAPTPASGADDADQLLEQAGFRRTRRRSA